MSKPEAMRSLNASRVLTRSSDGAMDLGNDLYEEGHLFSVAKIKVDIEGPNPGTILGAGETVSLPSLEEN